MGFSIVAIEQREKEAKALKTFLVYSLISSVALHTGILALFINQFFRKVPKVTEAPIEVTILETIPQKTAQLPVKIKSLPQTNSGGGGNQGGGISTPTETAINIIKSSVAPITQYKPIKTTNNFITKPSQPLSTPEPITKTTLVTTAPIENTTPEPVTTTNLITTKPIQTANTIPTNITPLQSETQTNTSSDNIPSNLTTSTQSSEKGNIIGNLGNYSWRNILGKDTGSGVGNGTGSGVGNGTGSGIGNGTGSGVGNGTGSGIGNGTGSGNEPGNIIPKPENTPVATAPKPPIENSSKLNRADCLECQIKYPDRARRRGIEGNPEVAIDTDAQGNVTRVRLISSSGDSELDEAAQQAAQQWKLTPTERGRAGVRASVNFAIKGSQRHRKLQERQIEKQREVAKKKPEKETTTPTVIESPQPSQRKNTPTVTDVPSENTTRSKQESLPSPSKSVSPPRQTIESEKPKQIEESKPPRISPQPVKFNTNNQVDEGRSERVQKSRKRLEEILRRRQKSSESPSPEAPVPPPSETTSSPESNSNSENSN
ncbi:MAG: TonB family protein [Cuspidothrix sp.]